MRKDLIFAVKVILIVSLTCSLVSVLFLSCKKEFSCQGCLTKNNKPPVAVAGRDQTITLPKDSASLDGSASGDPDGNVVSYKWAQIFGPQLLSISGGDSSRAMVKNLVMGVYEFELSVTDNGGLSAKDTVQIVVDNPAVNQPPIANAGTDQTIVLPIDTVILNGTLSFDPDGAIASYQWTKIAGPPSFVINSPQAVQTKVHNLTQGIYQFELKVTDARGLLSKDTVEMTVYAQPVPATCDVSGRPLVNVQLIPIGALSIPRVGLKSASDGNKILFAGGYGGVSQNEYSRVDIYDISANGWFIAELHGAYRMSLGMAAGQSGNAILFAGGRGNYEQSLMTTSIVDIYDASSNTWSTAHLGVNRAYMGTAALDNKVFFAGGLGWSDNQSIRYAYDYFTTGLVDIFNNTTGAWSTAYLTEPRYGLSANAVGNTLYFAGGGGNFPSTPSKTIDIFNASTNSWSTSQLHEAKRSHAAISFNNKVCWAGGVTTSPSGSQVLSSLVEIRDVGTGAITLSCLFQPNASFDAVVKDNYIVFFTGWGTAKNKFDIYNTVTNTWSVGVLPVLIEDAAVISVNNIIYLAGGYVNGTESGQVWKLVF